MNLIVYTIRFILMKLVIPEVDSLWGSLQKTIRGTGEEHSDSELAFSVTFSTVLLKAGVEGRLEPEIMDKSLEVDSSKQKQCQPVLF